MSVQHFSRRTAAGLAFGVIASAVLPADASSSDSASARDLEGRLIAPCCWTQTLDIHDSPIADQLRAEISKRLAAGEPGTQIEDDLAARYGEKIRAVPRGEDPRLALPVVVGGAMGLAAVWLAWLGVSWLRREKAEPSEPLSAHDDYNKQLDHALGELSDRS